MSEEEYVYFCSRCYAVNEGPGRCGNCWGQLVVRIQRANLPAVTRRAFARKYTHKEPILHRATKLRTPDLKTVENAVQLFESSEFNLQRVDAVTTEICAQWCREFKIPFCIAHYDNDTHSIWRYG